MNYSINELVSQSINDPLNQLAHLLDQSINQKTLNHQLIDRSIVNSNTKSISQSINEEIHRF